jgi:hypothetical protein
MLWRSGLCARMAIRDLAGSIRVHGGRSHVGSNRYVEAEIRGSFPQVENMAHLRWLRAGAWGGRAFSYKVLRLAVALSIAFAATAAFADQYTDISLETGPQVKTRLNTSVEENPDLKLAIAFYAKELGAYPDVEGLTRFGFRSVTTKDHYSLFFIPMNLNAPVASATEEKPLILSATGPKTRKVLTGIVVKKSKGPPAVIKETQVVDGKIKAGNGLLQRIFKCSVVGCAGAAGCAFSGPYWLPCLCLSCGSVVAACGVTEIFSP